MKKSGKNVANEGKPGKAKPKIDERFKAMFTDKDFKLQYLTDKRGRPVSHTSSTDLKNFYSVTTSESESDNDDDLESGKEDSAGQEIEGLNESTKIKRSAISNIENDDEKIDKESDDSNETSSDSSDDDDDADADVEDGEFDHKWQEWDDNAPVASEITKRLSLCNMDWDRIRAEDILSVFNSFKPDKGVIHSVKIYPSEFGLERMKEENLNGPAELVEKAAEAEEDDTKGVKEGSKYHREKLRQYQINRLKYYYAVIECDSPETTDVLYEQLNGMEYESSAVCMDLRFIPDDITFEQEPKWVALSAPDPTEYKPRLFTNSALQQVKVNLTWDETDPKRRDTLRKAFTEPQSIEKDIRNYLASSSESEEEDMSDDTENNDHGVKMKERIAKYKELLQSIEDKEKEKNENKFEMEIVWQPGLKEKTKEIIKEKIEKETLTPFEENLKKGKEKRKQKKIDKKMFSKQEGAGKSDDTKLGNISDDDDLPSNFDAMNMKIKRDEMAYQIAFMKFKHIRDTENEARIEMEKKLKETAINKFQTDELALLVSDPNQGNKEKEHTHGKKKKKKEKLKKTTADNFQMDITDARFSAIYTSHHYHIDPSDPHYKDSEGMKAIVHEKQKKRRIEFMDCNSPERAMESDSRKTKLKKRCIDPEEDLDIDIL